MRKTTNVIGSVHVGQVVAIFGNDNDVGYPATLLKVVGGIEKISLLIPRCDAEGEEHFYVQGGFPDDDKVQFTVFLLGTTGCLRPLPEVAFREEFTLRV